MVEPNYILRNDGTHEWRLNGVLHREGGPAQICVDGSKKWFKNGVAHREDGPAIEASDGYKAWIVEGQYHREDGPAIIHQDGSVEWCIDGKEIKSELVWIEKDPRFVRLMKIKGLYEVMMK